MSEKFLYEDGLEISLGKAYSFIQNIAGNRIRNFTRMITQSAGFLDDSFEIIATEKDLSQSSNYYLKMKAGGVVFPNGEVYNGNSFICRLPVQKSSATQYVKISHVTLKQTLQEKAFGPDGYANIIDGVKLDISTAPDVASDGSQLLVAAVKYFPDYVSPEYYDRRDPWVFFWSPSSVIDPSEILSFDIEDIAIRSSKTAWDLTNVNIVDSSDMNSELSTILSFPVLSDEAKHAWDLLVESSTPELTQIERRLDPHIEISRDPAVVMRLPNGMSARLRFRKNDAYRLGIATEWADSESEIEVCSYDDTVATVDISFIAHPVQSLLGVKISTTDDFDTACHLKLWLSPENNINTSTSPNYLLAVPTLISSSGIPYTLLPYSKQSESMYYAYELILSGFRILASGSGEILLTGAEYGEIETFEIPFGCDRLNSSGVVTSSEDENGEILYYDADRIASFYLPLSEPWTEGTPPKRYLDSLEFINYVPYPMWSESLVNFNRLAAEIWIGPFDENPPIQALDSVTISASSDIALLPNAVYVVSYKFYDGGWNIVVTGGAGTGAGTCTVTDVITNHSPRATIEIYRMTRDGESYAYTLEIGQDRDVHFPDSFYSDTEDLSGGPPEFDEGYPYIVKATYKEGGFDDRMYAQGSLKLNFVKKAGV